MRRTAPNVNYVPSRAEPFCMSPREVDGYSLLRATDAARRGDWFGAGFEREVSEDLAQRTGQQSPAGVHGFFVPPQVLARRDLTAAGAGAQLVDAEVLGAIDVLRPRMVCGRLGAQFRGGLGANASYARQGATVTTAWAATEATAATETATLSLSTMALTPRTLTAYIELSRLLTMMAPNLAEAMVRNDIASGLATAIDVAVLNGSGASGQPLGILGSSIGTFSGTTLAYAGVRAAESALLTLNGLTNSGELGYACRPATATLLATRDGYSTLGPLWTGQLAEGAIADVRAISSMAVPANVLLLGDWSQVLVAQWGALEIRVDPTANFKAGIQGVAGFISIDVGVLQPESFSAAATVT